MSEMLDLPVAHTRRSPVFVIGAARSGTSLLGALLRRYLKVNFGTESQFIVRFHRRLPEYGDLHDPSHLRRLIEDLVRERCFSRWTFRFGFVLDKEAVFQEALAGRRSFPGVLDAIFSQFARYHGMERWGDKTPEYNYNLPVLLSLFPRAQFLHIVRDGRDVALSTLRQGFGGANVYRAGVLWSRQLLLIQQFAEPLPDGQVLTLNYETLLAQPVETLDTVSAFLGIEPDASRRAAIVADVPSQVRSTNANKWRTDMSPGDLRLFEAVASDQLRASGYEARYPVAPRMNRAARLYWEADHLLRKTARPKYWVDHLYRARVRLRLAKPGVAASAPRLQRVPGR